MVCSAKHFVKMVSNVKIDAGLKIIAESIENVPCVIVTKRLFHLIANMKSALAAQKRG